MYSFGYRTKKDLKASVGKVYRGTSTSMFDDCESKQGHSLRKVYHVGPGAYDRKWYAEVWLDSDNRITKVK